MVKAQDPQVVIVDTHTDIFLVQVVLVDLLEEVQDYLAGLTGSPGGLFYAGNGGSAPIMDGAGGNGGFGYYGGGGGGGGWQYGPGPQGSGGGGGSYYWWIAPSSTLSGSCYYGDAWTHDRWFSY